jgi:phosphomannomutase
VKQLIVFDLDGTLAESKSAVDAEMVLLLNALLGFTRVAIISGGDWPQFEKQILAQGLAVEGMSNLSLLPACGTKFYQYTSTWAPVYSENLTEDEKLRIIAALNQTIAQLGFESTNLWGEQIEDRGSQITFSALGQTAPILEKKAWDPDFTKRKKMQQMLIKLIPEFSVGLGGTTSVDVTRPGIDKAYGIQKLQKILHVDKQDMLFLGDALFPGGNDYPVKDAGVASIQVKDPNETKRVIETIIACLR